MQTHSIRKLQMEKKKRRGQRTSLLSFHPVRTQEEDSHLQPGRRFSPEPNHADTLISEFQSPEV